MRRSRLLLLTAVLLLPAHVSAAVPAWDDVLTGTGWQLVSFGKAGAESPVVGGAAVSIRFEAGGKVGGSGGCNSYGGAYQVRGESLTLDRIVSTRRACVARETMQQEQRYFEALRSAGKFKLADEGLTIFYDGGRSVLKYVRNPPADSSDGQQSYENLDSPVELLASYYNAINRREYGRAFGYWQTPPGNLSEFARGYAETANVRLLVEPPTVVEGAVGSLYATIPTVLLARRRDGVESIFAGCYVVRRSNLRPPDIPKEDVWHIYKAELKPVAGGASIARALARSCQD